MPFALKLTVLALSCAVLSAAPAHADDRPLSCPARWGEPGKPLVTKPETAKAIFLAVEKDFFPAADIKTFPVVETFDEGGSWAVFRTQPPGGTGHERWEGGGQLELKVAKCDAAISDVHFSR